ncbi:unnamed protein product [Bursaphelenchus xylophilus]|uniref:(pine wood nematode) hypothetical protein n=1 Tax=Bursaphelenchus xylophilus TaxID=6326 RepID=A0A1I7RRI2_BURXY|nr:unnamed protein product [Bursaphelenchus xylophilus]CAG9131058.1 unnamed protein product [Bursaphelenchus xylophilus]
MECLPGCEVILPEIGTATVKTKFDACQSPAVLSFSVRSDGKITSHTFAAGNELEIRPLRNNYWQLNLRVRLRSVGDSHHAEACMETVRTGNLTCFMNGVIPDSASECSEGRHEANSGFLVVLLCVILVTCLLMIGVAVCTIMHRFYSQQKSGGSRKNSSTSTEKGSPQCPLVGDKNTVCSLKFPEDRLEVITEEEDEKEFTSECSEVNGNDKLSEAITEEVSNHSSGQGTPTSGHRASFIYKKDQVILPTQLQAQRRNSQPLIFPIESPKKALTTFG